MDIHSPQMAEALKLKGYLAKKSSQALLGWQKRFWKVIGVDLLYYGDDSLKDLKGKFVIRKILDISEEGNKVFTFLYEDRKYELKADSPQSRNMWTKGLKCLKRFVGDADKTQPNSPVKLTPSKGIQSMKSLTDLIMLQPAEDCIVLGDPMRESKNTTDVLKALGLFKMAQQVSTKRISSRFGLVKYKQGYLFVLSCKPLLNQYEDQEILDVDTVHPYRFNTLYKIKFERDKVKEVCRTSEIFSIEQEQNILRLNCGKRVEYVLAENGKDFIGRLRKAVDIGKEYHNFMNIQLKTNIDPLLKIYETSSSAQCKTKVKMYLESRYSAFLRHNPKDFANLQSFSVFFKRLIDFEKDYLNAIEVSNGDKGQLLTDFLKFIHPKVHMALSQFWNQKHQTLRSQDILALASLTDLYRMETAKHVRDIGLNEGTGMLVQVYLKYLKTKLINLVKNSKDKKTEPEGFCVEVYNFLQGQICHVVRQCRSKEAMRQVVYFMQDSYKLWVEEMHQLFQTATTPQQLGVYLSQITEFKHRVFSKIKSLVLNNGLDALDFDDCLNQTEIIQAQRSLYLSGIQKIFKIVFVNIDKSLLKKNIMESDLATLTKELNDKMSCLNHINPDDLSEIKQQIIRQIIQFQLTIISTAVIQSTTKVEAIIKKINIDRVIIEKEMLKLHNKETCDGQMGIFLDLVEFLSSDSMLSTRKHFKALTTQEPGIFNLASAKRMIGLKSHLAKDQRAKLYEVCVQAINSIDKQRAESGLFQLVRKESILQSCAMSSRRSTLTMGIERSASFRRVQPQGEHSEDKVAGYLKKKKVDNRPIKRMYERRYFTILKGHLLWYLNESSGQLQNKIDLKEIKMVGQHDTKKEVFFIHLDDCIYKFKAQTPQSCQRWVSVFRNQISNKPVESSIVVIQEKSQIFRDYGSYPTKPIRVRMQSTRESILSNMSVISKNKLSPSPDKQVSRMSIQERQGKFLKKPSLNIGQTSSTSSGCWFAFKNCVRLQ